ncbi:unnamed protein product [Diplocarpon coronariae]
MCEVYWPGAERSRLALIELMGKSCGATRRETRTPSPAWGAAPGQLLLCRPWMVTGSANAAGVESWPHRHRTCQDSRILRTCHRAYDQVFVTIVAPSTCARGRAASMPCGRDVNKAPSGANLAKHAQQTLLWSAHATAGTRERGAWQGWQGDEPRGSLTSGAGDVVPTRVGDAGWPGRSNPARSVQAVGVAAAAAAAAAALEVSAAAVQDKQMQSSRGGERSQQLEVRTSQTVQLRPACGARVRFPRTRGTARGWKGAGARRQLGLGVVVTPSGTHRGRCQVSRRLVGTGSRGGTGPSGRVASAVTLHQFECGFIVPTHTSTPGAFFTTTCPIGGVPSTVQHAGPIPIPIPVPVATIWPRQKSFVTFVMPYIFS